MNNEEAELEVFPKSIIIPLWIIAICLVIIVISIFYLALNYTKIFDRLALEAYKWMNIFKIGG